MLNNHIIAQESLLRKYLEQLGFYKTHYSDGDTTTFLTAFVHKSYASDFIPALNHNERLEFLGDSILGACIASLLYANFPDRSEAEMTLYKIALVREEMLAQVAREIELGQYIFLSKGEEKQNGANKDSILSDALEALIAAAYLIYGREQIYHFIEIVVRIHIDELLETNNKSYKSLIQERAQAQGLPLPSYSTINQKHDNNDGFQATLRIGNDVHGSGRGRNKKRAQESAAQSAYKQIKMQK